MMQEKFGKLKMADISLSEELNHSHQMVILMHG
jgi:hypothetical protein